MNHTRIRKLYDECDHLVNDLPNMFPDNLYLDITPKHWNEIYDDVKMLKMYAARVLSYVANEMIPDMEKHPEKEDRKPGGMFIDGERQ